jgi:hypothetical protein
LLARAAALVEVDRGVVATRRVDGDVEAVPDAELERVDEVGSRRVHVGRAECRDGVAVVHVAGRVAGVVERQRDDRRGGGADFAAGAVGVRKAECELHCSQHGVESDAMPPMACLVSQHRVLAPRNIERTPVHTAASGVMSLAARHHERLLAKEDGALRLAAVPERLRPARSSEAGGSVGAENDREPQRRCRLHEVRAMPSDSKVDPAALRAPVVETYPADPLRAVRRAQRRYLPGQVAIDEVSPPVLQPAAGSPIARRYRRSVGRQIEH